MEPFIPGMNSPPTSPARAGFHYRALATDFDETLAPGGRVSAFTLNSIDLVKRTGRKLLLVTGRELEDLMRTFPRLRVFDLVVCENGALLYDPQTESETLLAPPADAALVARLLQRQVPLSVGRSIVATVKPYEMQVLAAIRDLALEHKITFNKDAVMVLPAGVTKATGLRAALSVLDIPIEQCVGIGDAENDHTFLMACGCAVAVANALPSLIHEADLVVGPAGEGVSELARLLVETDLKGIATGRRNGGLSQVRKDSSA